MESASRARTRAISSALCGVPPEYRHVVVQKLIALSEVVNRHFDVESVGAELGALELFGSKSEWLDIAFHEFRDSGVALQAVL